MPTEGKDSPEKVSDIRFHSNMLILHNSIHKKESSTPTRYLSWRQRTYFGNGRQPPGDSQVRMHFYYFRANNHLSHLRQYWRDAFSFIHHANMLKSCAGVFFLVFIFVPAANTLRSYAAGGSLPPFLRAKRLRPRSGQPQSDRMCNPGYPAEMLDLPRDGHLWA